MNGDTKQSPQITVAFDLLLFGFCNLQGLIRFLLSDAAKGIPIQGLVFTSCVDLLRVIVVTLITAYFVREIWNRLILKVFELRNLMMLEAIAVVLTISLLSN